MSEKTMLLVDASSYLYRADLKETLVARGHARLAAFSLELEAGRLAHFLAAAARGLAP